MDNRFEQQSNNNGHTHDRPVETITVTFDPNHGQLKYDLQNMDYATAIQRLELAQLFLFDNLKASQKELTDGSR